MWLDTSLLFIGIVALLNTLMGFFNSATTSSGLFSLLALGFGGVLLCTQLTTSSIASLVNLRANDQVGKTFLVLGLAMLGWVLLYTATAFLPAVLNPQLPPIVMLIIGAVSLVGRYFLQKKYNILNAMTPQQ